MPKLSVDLKSFKRDLDKIAKKQVPFAVAMALNDTAEDVQADWKGDLELDLDRPTPFTLKGIYRRRASKRNQVAKVGFKPVQSGYLVLQMKGGTRRPKGRALIVPAGARLNKYGNMPRGAVGKAAAKASTFVAGRNGRGQHLKAGIYERKRGGKIKMLMSFKSKARYQRRLDLMPTAERSVQRVFPGHFATRFRAAMVTAK